MRLLRITSTGLVWLFLHQNEGLFMKTIYSNTQAVTGGHHCLATCQEATLFMLNQCEYAQLQQVNRLFIEALNNPNLTDDAAKKAAMIDIILSANL